MTSRPLFVTRLYQADLTAERGFSVEDLSQAARAIAAEDRAGQAWAKANAYGGYTSYASLNDLTRRDSLFDDLRKIIDRHVAAFARELHLDCGKLKLDSLWINILKPGAAHSGHIHPGSVISGTVYVEIPPGASALKLEDPRLPMMMAAPLRKANARPENRSFVDVTPKPGMLLLWESWLRHGVEPNAARGRRISVSFNYRND